MQSLSRLAPTRMPEMPPVILICEVIVGMGHLSRMLILASALCARFRVVLVVITAFDLTIEPPPGVEIQFLRSIDCRRFAAHRPMTQQLLALASEIAPVAVLVEYFPFGRHASAFFLLPFLKKVRRVLPPHACIFSSMRDVQDSQCELFDVGSIARMANESFDAILVHADPNLIRLEDTFPAAKEIRIPILYTGYVRRHAYVCNRRSPRSPVILVSAGGGQGGESLLKCAARTAGSRLLAPWRMRIIAGKLLAEQDWLELGAICAESGNDVELLRWVPDLFAELCTAAVSVSRFGYNTAQELLASGVPALVVPFHTVAEDEQARRAELLARRGAVRLLQEQNMTPDSLAAEILKTLEFLPAECRLRSDGAEQTCRIVSERAVPPSNNHRQIVAREVNSAAGA